MNTSKRKFIIYLFIFIGIFCADVAFAVDYNSRCTALGVALCTGFDVAANDIDPFVYGDDTGISFPTFDNLQKASGAGAIKFTIPPFSSANSSGGYDRVINESTSGFNPGDVFYVQFRQKLTPEMLDSSMGGQGWKQLIITSAFGWYGDPLEIGLVNDGMAGTPKLFIGTDNPINQNPSDGVPVTYVANQWMTFYFKITVGDWDTANSKVEVWAADENHILKKIYNVTATLTQNPYDPDSGLNKISLGPNNTDKPADVDHAPAETWYDELIVSTSPIADPYTPPTDTTAPSVPGNFNAVTVSTSQINLSWSASTDNVGVVGYKIYRDGTQIGTSSTLSYQNTGLNSNTTYSFSVSAYDATGNVSSRATVSAKTQTSTCSYAVQETPQNYTYQGGNGGFSVGVSAGTCTWTAVSNVFWIAITNNPSGTGNGEVRYIVAGNGVTPRTGTITVAGKTVTIIESGQ
jgi:hypothetical protein